MQSVGIATAAFGMLLGGVVAAAATDIAPPAPKLVPVFKASPPPVAAFTWTGCHLGILAGGAWGKSRHIQDDLRVGGFGQDMTDNFTVSGMMLGGSVGCDYQFGGGWVAGIENDISWTNKRGSANLIPPFSPVTNTFETNESWLDTQRLRLGYAWDSWLLYGTGGAAIAQEGVRLCDTLAIACVKSDHMVVGWTAGAGMAYALGNWSFRLEYLYVDLGTTFFPEIETQLTAGGNGLTIARDVKLTNNIVRAGLDYRFDLFK